jgi:tRNA (guanine37-N1)-methyltransferase
MTNPAKPKSHGRLSIQATAKPRELMTDRPDLAGAWKAKVITLFPQAFPGVLGQSLTGRALQNGLWSLETIDLRRFGKGKHLDVDDTPTGGGAGMVLKPDVVAAAFREAATDTPQIPADWPVIYVSPRGKPFTQAMARKFSTARGMTILCGRFEGVDQRVLDHFNVEEISLGDYILTGGEIAAQALIDASVRLIPRVLGNTESALEESFSDGLLEHPQFTRPNDWMGRAVPEILLSGHHANIAKWRADQSRQLTKERRPDLWRAYASNAPDGDQEQSGRTQSSPRNGGQKDD